MGQKVRIQYNIELEEFQPEILRLLQKAFQELNQITDIVNTISTEPVATLENIQTINEARGKMATTDYMFQDIVQLLGAYVSFKAEAATDADGDVPPPEPE
jgi:flagellar basal body P-ring protein FlgI